MPARAGGSSGRGCVFAGRCPWQLGRTCEEETPPWQAAGGDLRIRCHIPEGELGELAEGAVPTIDDTTAREARGAIS
jgi:hypothetical protein